MRSKAGLAIALLFCSLAAGQEMVHVGQAVVALTGPWKFHTGDNPRWADPNFDDSNWETVDLTPRPSPDYWLGLPEAAPGWTALGHSGYAGFAWYRLKVQIEQTDAPLSLLMPFAVDDGYEIYVNGREIGRFGDLRGPRPTMYYTTAEWFSLPATAPGQITQFAVRFYMLPSTPLIEPDTGGDAWTAAYRRYQRNHCIRQS